MPIEVFDTTEFIQALPSTSIPNGLIDGEYTYSIPLSLFTRIFIRSSIKSNGYSADTGKDSIRLILEIKMPGGQYKPLGKKLQSYITRVSGWQKRLNDGIDELSKRGSSVKSQPQLCLICGKSPHVGLSKSPNHLGRPFSKCPDHFDMSFRWLDIEPAIKLELSGVESMQDQSVIEEVEEAEIEENEPIKEQVRGLGLDDPFIKSMARQPNQQQAEAITMPVDSSFRVFACPGSGKTFCIEHRYAYLVQQGVNPDNILVVTFSKSMADEMAGRIKSTVPNANLDQISTIHALCYRILTRWDSTLPTYLWQVPKEWELKKILDELIDKYWKSGDEKPGYAEVLSYIDYAKSNCITPDESFEFFARQVGALFGGYLTSIRKDFDCYLARLKQMTFSDMVYYMERALITKPEFRMRWQKRFTHVTIDESQDCSFNAMRILITLSLEPGLNTVYEKWRKS